MTPEESDRLDAEEMAAQLMWAVRRATPEMAREILAENTLIRAFRNELDKREWVEAVGANRCRVLAERLARAGVAMLKERHLLLSGKAEGDKEKAAEDEP